MSISPSTPEEPDQLEDTDQDPHEDDEQAGNGPDRLQRVWVAPTGGVSRILGRHVRTPFPAGKPGGSREVRCFQRQCGSLTA